MSDMPGNGCEHVDGFLAAVRNRYRLYGALTGLVVLAAATVAWVIAEIIADRVLVLQMHHRMFLLRALEVTMLAAAAAMAVAFAVRTRSTLRVAAWVEKRYPELRNGLITVVELSRRAGRAGGPDDGEMELAGRWFDFKREEVPW